MKSKIISFEDLIIWEKAQQLARKIYNLSDNNSRITKDFALRNQLKSASISISDNIAEGFEYNNNADFYRFLRIAKGSCGETRNKILFLKRIEYIDQATCSTLAQEANDLGKQIGQLMKNVRERIAAAKKKVPSVTHNP